MTFRRNFLLTIVVFLSFCFFGASTATAKKKTKKKANHGLAQVLGDVKWGDSKDTVLKKMKSQLMKEAKKDPKVKRDPLLMQKARKGALDRHKRAEKSYTRLQGDNTGYEVSVIADEYSSDNGESFIRVKDKVAQRFYFFIDGAFYKLVVAYNAAYLRNTDFESFVAMSARKYGRPTSAEYDDIRGEEQLALVSWEDPETSLSVKNKKELFDTYTMAFTDRQTLKRLQAKKGRVGGSDKDADELSAQVQDLMNSSGTDANRKVVDDITAPARTSTSRKDVRRTTPRSDSMRKETWSTPRLTARRPKRRRRRKRRRSARRRRRLTSRRSRPRARTTSSFTDPRGCGCVLRTRRRPGCKLTRWHLPARSFFGATMKDITVVLFEPQDDINIGTVVRACANFGVEDVRLVRPASADPARVLISAPNAGELVDAMRRFGTLDEALGDCVRVFGMTARARSAARAVMNPIEVANSPVFEGRTALLFGREDHGLPNDALDRCDVEVTIPTAPSYRSLNLAQAVLLTLWELFRARELETSEVGHGSVRSEFEPADRAQLERMYQTAQQALEAVGFFKYGDGEHVMRSMRSMLSRAQLDHRELAIWFGIWKEVLRVSE